METTLVYDRSAGTVTISIADYEELKSDSEFLGKLQAAGVDNWEGYEVAQEM